MPFNGPSKQTNSLLAILGRPPNRPFLRAALICFRDAIKKVRTCATSQEAHAMLKVLFGSPFSFSRVDCVPILLGVVALVVASGRVVCRDSDVAAIL